MQISTMVHVPPATERPNHAACVSAGLPSDSSARSPSLFCKMLVCLACAKQTSVGTPTRVDDPHHLHAGLGKAGSSAAAPINPFRENVESITTQLKDIVVKFSSGAYRHCRPSTPAKLRGGSADEGGKYLCGEDDGKSSVLSGSHSEDLGPVDHVPHDNLISDYDFILPHKSGSASFDLPSLSYDPLPVVQNKRCHARKKKASSTSSSKSSLFLKQLASRQGSCDAIEELLDEHFRREERILAEEQSCASSGGGDQEFERVDHQLLEEAKSMGSRRDSQNLIMEERLKYGGEGHVKSSKRHKDMKGMESGEEWVAQVEPGVMITFVALPDGSNHIKRIRFSRELFSKWQAQLWWTENSDMVRELFSVHKTEPPFKPCSSARSSSSRASTTTPCSLHQQNVLQNTPELQSRVGSYQTSPANTPRFSRLLKGTESPLHPKIYVPITAEVLSSTLAATKAEAPLFIMVEQHDNMLVDNPELELCYNEGIQDSIGLSHVLRSSAKEDRYQQWQEERTLLPVVRVSHFGN